MIGLAMVDSKILTTLELRVRLGMAQTAGLDIDHAANARLIEASHEELRNRLEAAERDRDRNGTQLSEMRAAYNKAAQARETAEKCIADLKAERKEASTKTKMSYKVKIL